jgi:hypothetical protein
MSRPPFFAILAFSLLFGCVSDRPLVLATDNPASPTAREANTPPARSILTTDPLTERTRELIAARAAQETQGQIQPEDRQRQEMPEMQHEGNNQSQPH